MSVWDTYQSRLSARGETKRTVRVNRERSYLNRKLPDNLSYHMVRVGGEERQLAVINSDSLDRKTICTMPGEDILGGTVVEWAGNHWLVVAKDANNELYTKASMLQCNYLLRWIAEDGIIVERWCVISDGTKYLTGETISSYNENGMSLGDTRISMIIGRDEYTVQLNRSQRFLIDDYDSGSVLAYRVTKPFKLGGVFDGEGAMSFVMTEVNTEADDNLELHIADYYKHFPRESGATPPETGDGEADTGGKKVWL